MAVVDTVYSKEKQIRVMRYRDEHGRFISREEYLERQADERGDVDDWDDFEDFQEFDEEEYMGEG